MCRFKATVLQLLTRLITYVEIFHNTVIKGKIKKQQQCVQFGNMFVL